MSEIELQKKLCQTVIDSLPDKKILSTQDIKNLGVFGNSIGALFYIYTKNKQGPKRIILDIKTYGFKKTDFVEWLQTLTFRMAPTRQRKKRLRTNTKGIKCKF